MAVVQCGIHVLRVLLDLPNVSQPICFSIQMESRLYLHVDGARMAKSRITFKIDKELLRKFKALAAKRRRSVSALIVSLLEECVMQNELVYGRAKQSALARMQRGYDLGGRPIPRDELYNR